MRLPNVRDGEGSPEDLGARWRQIRTLRTATSGGTANGARTRQADAAGGISQNRTSRAVGGSRQRVARFASSRRTLPSRSRLLGSNFFPQPLENP